VGGFLINPPAFDRMNIMANGNIDESASLPEYLASVEVEDEEITPETAARLDRARASNESISHDDILREFGLKKLSSEEPQRIGVTWTPQGQADLCAIDRETAMGILHCLDRFIKNREGDIKNLKPPRTDYRLRCDDYRLFFGIHDIGYGWNGGQNAKRLNYSHHGAPAALPGEPGVVDCFSWEMAGASGLAIPV